uniref:Ig-like domain-containing protein n=1 Tax=Cyprinus carpio TaxID=7962 RepID=A0A8C2HSE9_CYPCA
VFLFPLHKVLNFITVIMKLPKAVVKVSPDERVFRGETVTLTCDIQRAGDIQWTYSWFKDGSVIRDVTERLYSITSVSDRAEYSCRGERSDSQRSDTSAAVTLTVSGVSTLTVSPDERVFRGERVTLTFDIQGAGDIQWTYNWFKYGLVIRDVTERLYSITSVSDRAEYSCRGERSDSQRSDTSAAVTLTVSDLKPKPELTSDPAGAALTGNTVTLICHMNPATGWDFYWYKHTLNSETKTQTNSYRVKIDSVSAGGQYWCRAGRGKPVYYTQYSDALWVNANPSAQTHGGFYMQDGANKRISVLM